jgi:hypothetical protein
MPLYQNIASRHFINLLFFNIVITKQRQIDGDKSKTVYIIKLLNNQRTKRLITFLSW